MDFLNDPEFLGGLFGFMDSEFVKCPHCNFMFEKFKIEGLIDPASFSLNCPACGKEISIDDLKSGLE